MSADEIRRQLAAIDKDREAFVQSNRLPSSDALIDVVVECVDNYQTVANQIEKFRERTAKRAVRFDDPAALTRLTALEGQLKEVTSGRNSFGAGSVWNGPRVGQEGSALQLRLKINDLTGTTFHGRLEQTGNFGRSDLMSVNGPVNGHSIAFETTGMIRGKNRNLVFSGYILGERIVARFTGISTEQEPVAGGVSLWRNSKSG